MLLINEGDRPDFLKFQSALPDFDDIQEYFESLTFDTKKNDENRNNGQPKKNISGGSSSAHKQQTTPSKKQKIL